MSTSDQASKAIWGSVTNHSSSSYALDGKIMVFAAIILFVAVILILCFHGYARWIFRRQNRRLSRRIRAHLRSLSASRDPSFASFRSPLDLTMLEKIPIFVYAPPKNPDASPMECAVCLSEFEEGDEGRVLPQCGHAFHVDCIDTWFRSRSNCPLCRALVQPESPATRLENSPSVTSESTVPVCPPTKPIDNSEIGSSSSSDDSSSSSSTPPQFSPVRFPAETCPMQTAELVSISVEIPRHVASPNPSLPEQNGSKLPGNRVLSLKRLWSI